MEKLKKCPFCNSEAELITNRAGLSCVRCSEFSCWISTKFCGSKEKAIIQWNTRAEESE